MRHSGLKCTPFDRSPYCGGAMHPHVLCWSRPIYTDDSAMPLQIEFGVLKAGDELWGETFESGY